MTHRAAWLWPAQDALQPLRALEPAWFERIFATLVAKAGEPDRLMIDATHLKAHRTAASLLEEGLLHAASGAPRAG